MSATATVRGYDAGAKLLHWAIAALILVQLAGGFALARLDIVPQALRFPAIQWHKTFGLAILALTLARIAWRLINPPPRGAPMSRPEHALAGLVHFLFYALMLAVPLTGWLMVSASPRQVPTLLFLSSAFPFAHLPVSAGARGAAEGFAVEAHTLLAYSFVALLLLHVAGALKHSVIDRAPSFSRMLPSRRMPAGPLRPVAIPVALALVAGFLVVGVEAGRHDAAPASATVAAAAPAAAADATGGWRIDKAASKLGYEVSFSGAPIGGSVGGWNAAITFDPDALATASARIDVDPNSVTTTEPFVQSNIPGPDGFDVANHPKAEILLDRFEKTADGFLGRGTATIRGKSLPVEAPFAFERRPDGTAHVVGSAVLDRIAFGLGLQNDPTAQFLGKDVTVRFDLTAAPAGTPPAAT